MFSASDLAVLADHTDGGRALRDMARHHADDVRVRVGGFVQRVLAHHHALMPAVGYTTARAVELAAADAREDLLEALLANHPDREWAREFARDKCVVPIDGRPGVFAVETRVPGLTAAPLHEYDADVDSDEFPVFTDKRTYSLDQFFSDIDVIERFPLSEQYLQTVRRCAVVKPHAAAEMVQTFLRGRGFVGVTVRAGKYVKSRKRAADVIKNATRDLVDKDFGVWSRTVDQKIFYYHDDASEVVLWSVEGPLRYAFEVKCIYDLCLNVGVNEAVQMLALETTLLGIEVLDVVTGRYVTGLVEAHVSLVGIEPTGDRVAPGLSVEEGARMLSLEDRILPILCDDKVIATSVRVTDRYSLVCNHVMVDVPEDSGMTVAGTQVLQHKLVGNDLWVVSCAGKMNSAWLLREARLGERVVMLYSVGSSLEVSSPVTVSNVDGCDIAMGVPSQLRKGMSGAAVVAVSDGALLGVYRGKTGDRALATVFGPVKYGELVDIEVSSHASISDQRNADEVRAHFERRGYSAAFRAACDAIVPLHSDTEHVGFGLCYGDLMVTPLDPDVYPLRVSSVKGRSPQFNDTQDGRFCSPVDVTEAKPLHAQSKPEVGARVVIVGKDTDGVYISEICTVVQVGAGARRFYIDPPDHTPGMPLVGGVVLSYSNASVVGQYVGKLGQTTGSKGVCLTTFDGTSHAAKAEPPSVTSIIASKFPMLSPVAWEFGELDKLLQHPKGGPLLDARALIGDSVMKIVGCKALERCGARVSTWTGSISAWQRNSALVPCAARCGLVGLFQIDKGLHIPDDSGKYADLVEALVGMAFLYEEWSVVEEFCFALGVVPREFEGVTPTTTAFSRMAFGSVEDTWAAAPSGSVSSKASE